MGDILHFEFDPNDHSENAISAAWTEFVSGVHTAAPLDIPGRICSSRANSWFVGELNFTHLFFNAQTMVCASAETPGVVPRPYLFAWLFKQGGSHIWHHGEMLQGGPDAFYLFDHARELHSVACDSEVMSLMIPHAAVGYDPQRHPSKLVFDLGSQHGARLREGLETAIKQLPEMTSDQASALVRQHTALYTDILERDAETPAVAVGEGDPIGEFIDENLFNPSFQIETALDRFQISRARLHQSLDTRTSFSAYARARRLDYAFRSLAFGEKSATRIADIAAYCDYPTLSQFSVAFADRFGFEPRSALGVLDAPAPISSEHPRPKLWDAWYRGP
ncbi:MAG: AraC family transcriptional regulator [Pseudomonadota bacterium]